MSDPWVATEFVKVVGLNVTLNPDKPIESAVDDAFGWSGAAEILAHNIADFPDNESLCVSIEGAWGAGKSSFAALVRNSLENKSGVEALKFSPWWLERPDLPKAVLSAIGNSISGGPTRSALQEQLLDFSDALSSAGGIVGVAGKLFNQYADAPIELQHACISKELTKQGKNLYFSSRM